LPQLFCSDTVEKIMFKKSVLAVAMALALGHSQAATVFNNGVPDLVSGTGMTENIVADNFTVGATFSITNIHFWSAQSSAGAYTGTVSWAIYSDVAGAPGTTLPGPSGGFASITGTLAGGSIGGGDALYFYDIPVAGYTLNAGSYWLALLNGNTPNPTPVGSMVWANSASGTGNGVYFDGLSWVGTGNEQAFRIDGDPVNPNPGLPEPGSIALVLAGLALCGGLRRAR
jgi:hypothetical protein